MADFVGDSADNIFTGGADADTAEGKGGNDTLSGNGGNDTLSGDEGADTLSGGDGDDWLYSGAKSPPFNVPYYDNPYTPPVLDTGTEVDTLLGGAGSDRLFAGYGDNVDGGTGGQYGPGDYLYISFLGAPAGVTADFRLATQVIGGGTITGIESVSWIQGSRFDDVIHDGGYNGGYNDFTAIFGMEGNDTLVADYYTGTIDGGDGNDIVDGRGSQYLQNIYGGAGNDTLYTATNTFATAHGGDGSDIIYSHATTYGGAGDDYIYVVFSYYPGTVYGEGGNDTIEAASNGSTIAGGAGADILMGDAGADNLSSDSFTTAYPIVATSDMGLEADVLTGAEGDDRLAIGYGDYADGGTGNDSLRLSLGGLASGISFSTAGIVSSQPFILGGGTIQNIEVLEFLRGTEFNDTLNLATQAQLLTVDAGAGDDVITSNGSSVSLAGGAGDDRFISGLAGDTFDGGAGFDTVAYSNNASGITLTAAVGTFTGAGGDQLSNIEQIVGSGFADTLNSGGTNIWLWGGGGNDTLIGGAGSDQLVGGDGDDTLVVSHVVNGVEVFEGNAGFDSLELRPDAALAPGAASVYSLVNVSVFQVERLDFASAAGSAMSASLTLQQATNQAGGGQLTHVDGGAGNDTLTFTTGVLVAGGTFTMPQLTLSNWSSPAAVGGAGDMVNLSATLPGSYTLIAREGLGVMQALNGNSGNDTLIGSSEIDILSGGGGADVLRGGAGIDLLIGGAGDDSYVLEGNDTVRETVGGGHDVVTAGFSYTLTAGAEVEVLTTGNIPGTAAINLTGNEFANHVLGNDGTNALGGGGGNDVIDGFGGDDSLTGGLGNDALDGGDGFDTAVFAGNRSAYSWTVSNGVTHIQGTDGIDTATNVERLQFADATYERGPEGEFAPIALFTNSFGASAEAGGWINTRVYPRVAADIDGDGRADLVGFGGAGVYAALTGADGEAGATYLALNGFGSDAAAGGWVDNNVFPRTLADIDGDGLADLVGFGAAGVYASLATGGGHFGNVYLALNGFGSDAAAGGWRDSGTFPRLLADLNGDGMDDLVGFGAAGVYASLATGGGHFGNVYLATAAFGTDAAAGGWADNDRYTRTLGDVNGDGRADIVGFGEAGTFVALAKADGTFGNLSLAYAGFGASPEAGGWTSNELFTRTVGDIDGDGLDDIVGFADAGVFVARSDGHGGFAQGELLMAAFGPSAQAGGWASQNTYPRALADLNGDGALDILGFGAAGTFAALSTSDWIVV